MLASLSQGGLAIPPAAPQPTYGAPVNGLPNGQTFRPPPNDGRPGYNAYPSQPPPPQPAYAPPYQTPAAHTYTTPSSSAPAVVPAGAAVNPAFANPAAVAPVRPNIPSSGYGQHPHLSAPSYQPSYAPSSHGPPPGLPPSMNNMPPSMPPYGGQQAAAPPATLPMAGGMSDLLALLVSTL